MASKKRSTTTKKTKKKKAASPVITLSPQSLSHSGIEIYKTKDTNIEETSEDDEKEGFVLQNGEITEIAYYNEIVSDSFEEDYEDISTNASVTLLKVNGSRFYAGRKISLRKSYNPKKWKDLKEVHLGFITEQTYTEDGVDIKISGMSKLLEQEKTFSFTHTKISKILEEIIKASGLKAKVDPTGLDDKEIDYTNVSSSGSSSGKTSSTGSASIDEAVKNAIKGVKDDLEKAKAIDSAFKNHVLYDYYWNVHHPDLEEAWQNANLNCADGANVLCAMFIAGGLSAVIHHTPGENGGGHYIVIVHINGTDYATDNAANSGQHTTRPFGETWGPSSGDEVGTKIPE